MRRNIFDQNIVHCLFDIGHFQQLIGAASRTINLAFDVVRERGVVAFDPGGPQALQGVEQRFELEENLRRGISLQPNVINLSCSPAQGKPPEAASRHGRRAMTRPLPLNQAV